MRLISILLLVFMAISVVVVRPVGAQSTQRNWQDGDVQVSVGLLNDAGKTVWKPGYWVPFRVKIAPENENVDKTSHTSKAERFTGRIVLELPDSDGVPMIIERRVESVALPAEVELCGRLGHSTGDYHLKIYKSLENGERLLYDSIKMVDEALPNTKGVMLVVGQSEAGLDTGVAQMPYPSEQKPIVVRVDTAKKLPSTLTAWELIDTIVVTTENEAVLKSWESSEIARLATWTQRGGTLVMSIGRNAERLCDSSDWNWANPGKFEKVIPVRETSAMEIFAQSPIPVTLLGVSEQYRIQTARFFKLNSGVEVRAQQYDLPLVLRRAFGLGQIHWVTFDLEHPAVARWEGRGNFLVSLLNLSGKKSGYDEKVVHGMQRGYDDISGQLRSALDDFIGLKPISFGILTLFFFLYIIIIGPGCWYLCRKLPRCGEIASWATFLGTTVLSTFILLWFSATQNNVRMNQVQVADYVQDYEICGQEVPFIRQTLWGNVWAPDAHDWTIALLDEPPKSRSHADVEHEKIDEDMQVAWFGLPGAYLGGMDSRMTLPATPSESYLYQGSCLKNVPFFARSTRSFTASRWKPAPDLNFGSLKEYNQTRIVGEVHNPLSVGLEHCILLYGGWAYEIGRLEPGQTFAIHEGGSYFSASALLVDAEYIEDNSLKSSKSVRRVNRPYEPTSRDLAYIMRTILFFEKTGGKTYTSLFNQYLHHMDVSELLSAQTAVLYGVAEADVANIFSSLTILNPDEKDAMLNIPQKNSLDKNVRILRVFFPVQAGE